MSQELLCLVCGRAGNGLGLPSCAPNREKEVPQGRDETAGLGAERGLARAAPTSGPGCSWLGSMAY